MKKEGKVIFVECKDGVMRPVEIEGMTNEGVVATWPWGFGEATKGFRASPSGLETIRFSVEPHRDAGKAVLKISEMTLRQRREAFRVAAPEGRLVAKVWDGGGSHNCPVIDVSSTGVRFQLPRGMRGFQPGHVFSRVEILDKGRALIGTAMEMRCRGGVEAGCRFVGARGMESARVQRVVNELQIAWRRGLFLMGGADK